ncbi:MAG: helix-turn-helix domain-containing protein [Pseudonocardiaceae bacterium]
MTGDHGDLAADDLITERVRLAKMRRGLGASLAGYREIAGVSQTELAKAVDRSPSMVSKVENGEKCLSAPLWKIADQVCTAQGALLAEYRKYAEAERDVRARWQDHHRQKQRPTRLARAAATRKARQADPATGARCALLGDTGDAPSQRAVLAAGARAQEMMAMFGSLVRAFGRRRAIQMLSLMTATLGLAEHNTDEHIRLARAVDDPDRIDGEVVRTLWATLARYRRLDDKLGPCAVLEAVLAQHELVHHLLREGPAEQRRKQLRVLDSAMASAIGNYLIDLGDFGTARRWLKHARKAAHDGGSPAAATYAAALLTWAARLAGETPAAPAALDAAETARSLAAHTGDHQVKALMESFAAGAYALDGHYDACMGAVDRAHGLLTTSSASALSVHAYWVGHPNIDSLLSTHFVLLGRPRQAVDAASAALAQFDHTNVARNAVFEARLGHALVLAKEIPEAVRVLGSAARHADLSPRLTAELRHIRALLQPWANSRPVQDLDTQLHTYRLNGKKVPRPGTLGCSDPRFPSR